MSEPPPKASGQDLARQALAAYKASRPTGPAPARRSKVQRRAARDGGRDPIGFAALLENLGAEQGWAMGVQGGGILDRWAELCPQYEGRVQAVAFDAERGRLDLRPGSDSYAAQLRLLGGQLCRQINDKLNTETVRSIRVLPVGRLEAPRTRDTARDDVARAEDEPVRTRESASPGYHRALAVHREHHTAPETNTPFARAVAKARARQDAALIAKRLPDEEHSEYLAELDRLTKDQPVDRLAASVQAALSYKHHGQSREPQPVFRTA
ncbi:DciA family protein [Streptomyces sp. NPDC047981]|uniref:DciA family protein n=1 Tax=Streptomyces sp. NPDC047981 TaxID=3154610 RepID=UPI003440E124